MGMSLVQSKPLWTMIIFSYNQERYIEAAINGALSQTYGNLEIIISDDFSSDRTYDIAEKICSEYSGRHHVWCRRNPQNLGLISHINLVVSMAKGEGVVVAAGDDISLPNRVEEIQVVQNKTGALVIYSSAEEIDSAGRETGRILADKAVLTEIGRLRAAWAQALYLGATGAWTKELYERFGPITHSGAYEDQVIGFRARLVNSSAYVDRPLVKYRSSIGISSSSARFSSESLNNCIALQRQKLKDLFKVKPYAIDMAVVAIIKLLACVLVNAFTSDRGR